MTATQQLRVLVVDDSDLFRQALTELFNEDHELQVIGTADTAASAIRATLAHKPDVVTLDIGLPDHDGFEVVQQVMGERPTPILVVTATLNPSWRREAYHALTLGAVDVMQKPSAAELADIAWRKRTCERLKFVGKSLVLPHVLAKIQGRSLKFAARPVRDVAPRLSTAGILAIVGSAGSPRALSTLFSALRPHLPLRIPIVVAIHLGRLMAPSLAQYLAEDLGTPAQVLTSGTALLPGKIYVAPGGQHVGIEMRRAVTVDTLPGSNYCPNLDHLLLSIAKCYGNRAMAVMLSGMGNDGCRGMQAIFQAGGTTLAQNEASCLVASMPRAAKELGAITAEQTLEDIAQALATLSVVPGPG